MPEKIIITPEDLGITAQPSPQKIEITEHDLTPPEAEQLGVTWGSPDSLDDLGRYPLDDTPRIHKAELTVLMNNGEAAQESSEQTVFAAHGYRDTDGGWVLKDGRKIVDVIEEWNRRRPDLKIDFAAVCNPTEGVAPHLVGVSHASGTNLEITGLLDGIVPKMTVRMSSDHGVITTSNGRKVL